MKKRKNIILSAITCFVSICMLMLGVYAASSPSVSIGGQVSYTARDASVLVQGVTNNSGTAITAASFASMGTLPENQQQLIAKSASDKKNTQTEYMDWTKGNGVNSNETMSDWTIGEISFAEDSTGIKAIKVGFRFTNYSNYPITATLTFDKTVDETSDANVTRTSEEQDKVITKDLGVVGSANASATVEITFAVTDDSKGVNADGLLGMNIKFEKTGPKASLPANSIEQLNTNNAKLTMGKQSQTSVAEDVEWKCIAYSDDGTSWTRLDADQSIPENAKYGYFVLDTFVESLTNIPLLASNKFTADNNGNAHHTDNDTPSSVWASDYYYSDVRKGTLKKLETLFGIDTESDLYNAIQGRTVFDLYKDMPDWYKEQVGNEGIPSGANGNEIDKFWLLSLSEVTDYFSDNDARVWGTASYWTRTIANGLDTFFINAPYGSYDGFYEDGSEVSCNGGVRPAFKLQLA